MNSIDITRNGFVPAKRYSGVLHTQGSVLLDADQNEAQLIDQHGERRVMTDLLVTAGSTDAGFRIAAAGNPADPYDFLLRAGTFYLGGMRLDMPQDERFRLQTEWLQQRNNDNPSGGVLANDWLSNALSSVEPVRPAGPRTDLVWIEGWEQTVTGTEDAELIETAFAAESSARLRSMRRVHVFPNAGGTSCSAGFASLTAALQATGRFTYDAGSHQLRSNRRMKVDFVAVATPSDPCTPAQRRGFLGAENETIQVRTLSDNRFVWSFSNAAPLYRGRFTNNTTLHLDTPPRDALLRPLVGDIIEVVRPDAWLPNKELIGERHGLFYRVATSFDPATGNVVLEANAHFPLPIVNDTGHAVTLNGGGTASNQVYLRIWRGEAAGTGTLGTPYVVGTPVPLGNTGLTVTFTGLGPVGDSWTFSVRPNTPQMIMPWAMKTDCPPTGPNRFIAGLGLITWNAQVATAITDCRRRVRKLENASGCCEVTVGDNQESFGDVSSIADALALLPPSGGKVCLLRGSFAETVSLIGRQNITIEGCGKLTRLRGGAANRHPVFSIRDCEGIKLRGISIEANDRVAVAIDDTGTMDFGEHTRNIRLEALMIQSRDAPAVIFNGGEGLVVEDCRVDLEGMGIPTSAGLFNGMVAAMLLFGSNIRVEGSAVIGQMNTDRAQLPIGGIHIIGGSEGIELRRNHIARSAGSGIVLGSFRMVPKPAAAPAPAAPAPGAPAPAAPPPAPMQTRLPTSTGTDWFAFVTAGQTLTVPSIYFITTYMISPDGCTTISTTVPVLVFNGVEYVPDADPFIVNCRIIDNQIDGMGESGIAPGAQFDLSKDHQLCGVVGLEIRKNRIRDCARNEASAVTGGAMVFTARGGVVLGYAEALEFADNVVEGCGAGRNAPICGFFAAALANARLSRNRIHDNGLRLTDITMVPPLGQRGGVVIRAVQPPTVPYSAVLKFAHALSALPVQAGRDALIIQGNEISAPEGRALQVQGIGAMSITGNQLVSLGAASTSLFFGAIAGLFGGGTTATVSLGVLTAMMPMINNDPFATLMGNAVVSVVNLAFSADAFKIVPFTIGIGFEAGSDGSGDAGIAVTTGRVLFNANQTRYDGLSLLPTLVPILVGLLSLDDITMSDNQCDADYLPMAADIPLIHGCAVAPTMRMASNRFSEPDLGLDPDGFFQQLSGLCVGLSAFMHHNFGTHCFLAIPFDPAISVITPNRSFVEREICEKVQGKIDKLLGVVVGRFAGSEMTDVDDGGLLMAGDLASSRGEST